MKNEFSNKEEYYEFYKNKTGNQVNIDIKQSLDYDLKEINGKYYKKIDKESIEYEFEEMYNFFPTEEELWDCK
jgi:hypothetical protein